MRDLVLRDCSTCADPRAFEELVCTDGHGADCPELACTACGEAVLVGHDEFDVTEAVVGPPVAAAA